MRAGDAGRASPPELRRAKSGYDGKFEPAHPTGSVISSHRATQELGAAAPRDRPSPTGSTCSARCSIWSLRRSWSLCLMSSCRNLVIGCWGVVIMTLIPSHAAYACRKEVRRAVRPPTTCSVQYAGIDGVRLFSCAHPQLRFRRASPEDRPWPPICQPSEFRRQAFNACDNKSTSRR